MTWHPLALMRIIFVVLVTAVIIVGLTTRARPSNARQWALVWAALIFLAWALAGLGWLHSR
jgi:hypothetical protein